LASTPACVDLARHAQDESARTTPAYHPRPDSPLTDEGVQQARDAGAMLTSTYNGIVYSPILRAKQTAQAISKVSGIPLLAETPLLSEWRPPSCVYGKTPDEYDDDYRAWRYKRSRNPDLAYQDGESLSDLHLRAIRAVNELRHLAADNGPLLVVSHKVLLGVIVHRHCGPADAFQRAAAMPWPHCETRLLTDESPEET
jgi:broad specificity phosphatase PhoE